MNYSVKIAPEANIELDEALDYYSKINTKLSSNLFNIIFDNFDFLKIRPYSFTIKYKNIRVFPIEKFPFNICYFIDEYNNTVNIISIFNTHRDPLRWKDRAK